MPLVIGLGHFAGVNADAMTLMRGSWNVFMLLPAVAALPVLVALCRRSNDASDAVRWIWRRGKFFLTTSCLLDALCALVPHWGHQRVDDEFMTSLATSIVDAYFLIYVVAARRVHDTFLEFPPRLPTRP